MHKKIFLTALIVLGLFTLVACGNSSEKIVELDEFLIREGIALTCDMDELAESEEYMTLMTPSDNVGQIAEEIALQDYNTPTDVYLVELPNDVVLQTMKAFSEEIDIPDNIIEKLKYKVNGSVFANMINARYGSEMIAATAMTTWGKSYIEPSGWSDNMILIFEYPGEFSSMVSFIKSGDDVISGISVFVKNGDEDILSLLGDYLGNADIDYVHYTSEQVKELINK